MAGALRRQNATTPETEVFIRAMRDSNIPKFLSHDLPLFRGDLNLKYFFFLSLIILTII